MASTSKPLHWPADLFERIVHFSGHRELCTLSRVNQFLSTSALRALYRSITLDQRPSRRRDLDPFSGSRPPSPAQGCLETLKSNDNRASLVHNLNIQWQRQTTLEAESMSIDEFGDLLKDCLMRLVNLEHLSLDFNLFETFPALNDVFHFKLISFSTTLPWNEDLVAFLGNQASSLQDLRLDCEEADNSITLQNRSFPALSVLHWGGHGNVDILSAVLQKTWQDLEQLHVNFAEVKAAEDVIDLLRQYTTIPSKLAFTFDVMGTLGYVSGLQTEELLVDGPCVAGSPEDLMELRLSNFERLKTLTFVLTELTRDQFTPVVKSTACKMWFNQCPTLKIVAFQDEECCDMRVRPG